MSRKIVRVFQVTEQAAPVSKSEQHKALITEILGFGKKTPPPESTPDDEDEAPLKADGETSIEQVLGRIFSTPSDSVRAVLFMNDADLKSRYLKTGGEAGFAATVDEQIFDLAQDGDDNSVFMKVEGEFNLDDVTTPLTVSNPFAVILNIKKPIWDKFVQAKTPDEKRAAFAACISHKFYVAVLNTNNIRKAKVGGLGDLDERIAKFNIRTFITSYPQRSVIDAARSEFDRREAEAPEAEAAGDEEIIKTVTTRAVNFVMINMKGGKLKISPATFAAKFSKIVDEAPELAGKESLKGEIIHAIANHPSIKKAKAHSILGDLVPAPDDAPEQGTLTIPSGKSPEPVPEIDAEMGAEKIAATLAANPRLAKQVMAQLNKYAI